METRQEVESAQFDELKTKELRDAIGAVLNEFKEYAHSRETALARTKLQEARMWLGQHLGHVGGEDLNAKRDAAEGFENTGR